MSDVVNKVRAQTPRSLFQQQLVAWKSSQRASSSITAIVTCPAYQRIIGMGRVAVPLILAQLEAEGEQPDMWFWALKAITGADPVAAADQGDMVAMSRAWIAWGRQAHVP